MLNVLKITKANVSISGYFRDLIEKFNKRVQLFPKKEVVVSTQITYVFDQVALDQELDIVRLHGSHINTLKNVKGLFRRDSCVVAENPETGLTVKLKARGAGGSYTLRSTTVALSKDSQFKLGLTDPRTDLIIRSPKRSDFKKPGFSFRLDLMGQMLVGLVTVALSITASYIF